MRIVVRALVQVEQHLPLGVERRLRRVQIFGSCFFPRLQGPRREGDHPSAFVGDWEHDPLAEPVVERPHRPISLFLRAEKTAGSQRIGVGHAAQPVAQAVKTVWRVANAEGLDSLRRQSSPGQVFVRYCTLRPAQLLLEPVGGCLVQVQQARSLACSCGLLR